MNKNKNIKQSLLLGASIIAINFGLTHSASAQICNGSVTATCIDFKGNPTDASNCIHDGSLYNPEGYRPPSGNDPRGQTCPVACPPPPPYGGDGDGGDGGGDGGYSDASGDNQGDAPSEDGGEHGTTDGMGADGPSGDGGSGGDGGTVLCTYFYRQGALEDKDYYNGFIYSLENSHPATWRGYHFWAVPYVKYLYKNPNSLLAKIIKPVVLHRAKEISYKLGLEDKPDYLGKLFRSIIEPISFTIGLFVKETDYTSLYTKQEFEVLSQQYKRFKLQQKKIKQMAGTPLASFTT